jgi:hypothetical protein
LLADICEFSVDVLHLAIRATLRKEVWLPAAFASGASAVAMYLAGWNVDAGAPPPSAAAITTMILVILGRLWLSLILTKTALAVLRGRQHPTLREEWVPVTQALEVLLVSLVLLFAIAAGTLVLVLPGIYLLLIWSQVVVIIRDGQARLFDAPPWSSSLTAGHRWHVLAVWVVVWLVSEAGALLSTGAHALGNSLALSSIGRTFDVTADALSSSFGVAVAAALYFGLEQRKPWATVGIEA